MEELSSLSIKTFRENLIARKFSVFEATEYFLRRIEEKDNSLGAFVRLFKEDALTRARVLDSDLFSGARPGILAGIPLGIKDIIVIEGATTSAASKILSRYRGGYNATVVKKIRECGGIILGQTNMDEFAMGSSTENSAIKKTVNPNDSDRVPGGSSGGSAASVRAGLVLSALGSDTGGSIRQPSAFCGAVGFKPTYGAVSRFGLIAMASSLDQIGPIAKTAGDAAIVFEAIHGHDPLDANSGRHFVFTSQDVAPERAKDLVIGLPKEYFADGLEDEVSEGLEEAINHLKKLGVKFKEISLPNSKYAVSCYYILMPAEIASNLARFDGIRYASIRQGEREEEVNKKEPKPHSALEDVYFKERSFGFGKEARRRILLGNFVLSSGYYDAYYAKAQKTRELIISDFKKAFNNVDLILTPVTPTRAFKFGDKTSDPLSMYLSDIFTIPVNLAGLPAISLPVRAYKDGELPVGFQLIGDRFRDADILSMGVLYERD